MAVTDHFDHHMNIGALIKWLSCFADSSAHLIETLEVLVEFSDR